MTLLSAPKSAVWVTGYYPTFGGFRSVPLPGLRCKCADTRARMGTGTDNSSLS